MKKLIALLLTSLCLVSCTKEFDPFPFPADEATRESQQYDMIRYFYTGEIGEGFFGTSGYYSTSGREFPIFDKYNLDEPSSFTLFAGERGDEIRLYYEAVGIDRDEMCSDPDILSDWNLGCTFSCNGKYPTIYKGKVIPVEPFVYKVVGEYDEKYSALEKEEADFYIKFLENGELLFYYNDEEYDTVDFNDDTPNYTAYYTEPDGIEGDLGFEGCKFRLARKDPAEKDRK